MTSPDGNDSDALLEARHQLLTQRDHVIGLEAETAELQLEVKRLTKQKSDRLRAGGAANAEVRTKLVKQRDDAPSASSGNSPRRGPRSDERSHLRSLFGRSAG